MPSWQARTVSLIIRLVVKRHHQGSEQEVVELIRRRLGRLTVLRPAVANGVQVRPVEEGQVKGEWVEAAERPQLTIYYLHGGGYMACSPATHRQFCAAISRRADARVFSLDYRLAPEHRFPAAVEDAVQGYRWLLAQGEDPARIVIGGDSAGGGLTMATLLSLRDQGLPLPRAAFCFSPWTDLTASGQSLVTNNLRDSMFYGDSIRRAPVIYLGSAPATDPLASPIFGDLTNLPPLMIFASKAEVLLDDSVRLAERARQCGVEVDLRLWDDLPHAWPVMIGFKLPEARAAIMELADFIRQRISAQSAPQTAVSNAPR
ncbi:MAG TPA: alpha/beta hydrolase [Blastocatellia bacterium]|nr:alpha/beta hydrolase [Blastocatellia bacterium]